MSPEEKAGWLRRINVGFCEGVPHNQAIGLEVIDFFEDGCLCRIPYDPRLIGNPETGVLHGGVITAMLDAACGAAAFIKLRSARRIATLDLRIDYQGPSVPGSPVHARATCFKVTKHVAFTRAIAFNDDEERPIATATGTFIIFEQGRSKLGEAMRSGE